MAKPNKPKIPKWKHNPSPKKKPKSGNPKSSHHLNPAWRFSNIEMADPYGWHVINEFNLLRNIVDKLKNFETMTWDEILLKGKKQHHSVPVQDLCKKAKSRIEELQLDDVDKLVSLRIGSTERIWGILTNGILLLVWWDPDHEICPNYLKHT